MAEHDVSEMAPNEKISVFMLNVFSNQVSSQTKLFLSYERAVAYFAANITDEVNEWCRIDKWQETDGELTHKIDFYMVATGETWFFEDYELDNKEIFGEYFSIKHPDLNFSVPSYFHDVLRVSGLPFAEKATLLITDISEEKPLDPESLICKIIDPKELAQYPLKLYGQKFAGSISPLYRLTAGNYETLLNYEVHSIIESESNDEKEGRIIFEKTDGSIRAWWDERFYSRMGVKMNEKERTKDLLEDEKIIEIFKNRIFKKKLSRRC
jgi:hypothetical protein